MAHLRFERVRDVIDAFPSVAFELDIEPSDEGSLDFLSSLAGGGELDKAVGFCAYLLPRREAVWWGCRSRSQVRARRAPWTSGKDYGSPRTG